MPDLKLGTDPDDPVNSSHTIPFSSTPFCDTEPVNKTFDISQISPLTSNPQDVATIVAEVSAAATAQASKEFCCMQNPRSVSLRVVIPLMLNYCFDCGVQIFCLTFKIVS